MVVGFARGRAPAQYRGGAECARRYLL